MQLFDVVDMADVPRDRDVTIDRDWLRTLTGAFPPLATRTPMSAAEYKAATRNVVFGTPQKRKAVCVANEAPAKQKNNHVVIPCRVRWYNKDQGWGYASPQQICRSDVRISTAVIRAAGLDSVAAGEMFMVTFERTQARPNAIIVSPITARPQHFPSLARTSTCKALGSTPRFLTAGAEKP